MLKVVSILMIVFGIIAAVFNVIGIVGGGASAILGGVGIYIMIQCIIGIIASIFEVIGGFKGLGAINEPAKAPSCVKYGVICAVLALVSIAISIVIIGMTLSTLAISIVCSLLIPGLYIYGLKGLSSSQGAN